MRTLTQIRSDFKHFDNLEEPQRTDSLVVLMNELEHDYKTFKIYPLEIEMNDEAMKLYQEISNARD